MSKYIYWETISFDLNGYPKIERVISKERYNMLKQTGQTLNKILKGEQIIFEPNRPFRQIAKKEKIK